MKSENEMFGLAQAACKIAERGAIEYLNAHKLSAKPETLSEFLRFWTKAKFQEAMHDAKEAIGCGMEQVAMATFTATMIQAGIEAAKEASYPAIPVHCA